MANSFTYDGTLNVTGDLRVNGRHVYTEAPKEYDMNGKIVTHRAIPIHTVRPGYRYCFPNGHIYIRGLREEDLQEESFEILWKDKLNYDGGNAVNVLNGSYEQTEVAFVHSIVVYIPKDFDARAFLTDSAYVQKLCFRTPVGKLKTTSPNFEIHNGKNVCIAEATFTPKNNYLSSDQWDEYGDVLFRLRRIKAHESGSRIGKCRIRTYNSTLNNLGITHWMHSSLLPTIWNNTDYYLMRLVRRRFRYYKGPESPIYRLYKVKKKGSDLCGYKIYLQQKSWVY